MRQLPAPNNRNILVTGASSGIGYEAALGMLRNGHKLILPCRNESTSKCLFKRLEDKSEYKSDLSEMIFTPIVDLSDLRDIEDFAKQLLARDKSIDTLILNAGLQYTGSKSIRWSSQGFELTFAVNHLAHQYLTESISSLLCNSRSPRVVITASEVHNPESPGGRIGKPAGLGEMLGIRRGKGFSMVDGISNFDADKAYKDTKLCNILFGRELYRRLNLMGFPMPVIAWAPGLVIPRTNKGFFRYSRQFNELGQRLFSLVARDFLRITESPEKAGELLFKLATEPEYNEVGFSYFSNRILSPGRRSFDRSEISNEANQNNKAELLWEYTKELYNLA
ncbi:SDR family NAD(P)-dependent oxidoreductase [Prochlorococcus sp. MIT 1307]|uniref:SDR family NAD(P)-dependent oxidoreductase n=1 Tax=Prochlorococcus sp. MIT 1307 TaxID=3096219 RepID=UPI002A75B926|nr:SDR family NAD(P)-dependent oxidoreductase [Prochlorococcus sp. MIT 1307]